MRKKDLTTLFDHSYWANGKVREAAGRLPDAEFNRPSNVTTRDLRATLVHVIDDESLARPVDASVGEVRLPLWQFLVHLLTHDAQQRSDAATLLSLAGQSPGDLDFLDYVDATREAATP